MAVQDIPEGTVATGPNGEMAVRRGGVWVREGSSPAAQAPRQGYTLQPMQTPTDRRAEEDRAYRRERDRISDERSAATTQLAREASDRAKEAAERARRAEERSERGGTPELRGRLAFGLGPSILAQDSLARQEQGVNPLNRDWGASLVDMVPDWGLLNTAARVWGGQDFQDYNQSIKTVEASLLPIFSGMAVTPQEAQRFIRANQPQLGDSPQTLERKAQNRQTVLNEAAFLTGREMPYPNVGRYGDMGFRDQQNEDQPEAASLAPLEASPGGGSGPGGTPDRPIEIGGMSATDLLALPPGAYLRYPDGQVKRLSLTERPEMGANGREVSPGVYERETPQEVAAARQEDGSALRQVDAGVRGVADFMTIGLADEIAAGANTVLPLDRGSRSGFTDGFGEAYRNNLAVQRGVDRADEETAGAARLTGQVVGGLAFAPRAIAQGGARIAAATGKQAVRAATRRAAVRGAGEGAALGAGYGFGSAEGSAVERAPNALTGAVIGAPAGLIAPYAANAVGRAVITPLADAAGGLARFAGRQAGRAGNALGVPGAERLVEASAPNALRSGLNRLADRSPQNVNALNANAARYSAETIEPTAADVVDDGARGLMRALGTRQTPARQAAREFTANRAEGLQDRISTQARRTISDDPRMPSEIRDQAGQRAREQAAPLYEQAYAQPVEMTEELSGLLQTPAGQAAMDRARRIAANERREINLEQPDMQTLDYVKRGLDDVLEGYRDRTTGRMALDTEGRAVQDVLSNFRGELDRINPSYAAARATYADSAKLQGAVDLGEQFMRMEADQFAAAIARLSPEEQEVARAAARRAVERAAGTQGQAPGVAQRLSGGREQGMRSEALLGDAEPMQRAMGTELEALRNAQAINPAQGSPTSMNLQDAGNAAGIMSAVANPGRAAASAIINRVRSRGFNDQEAEAVVQAAIDPNRTQEVIDILSQRMSRREARNLSRVIRRQVTIGLQSDQPQ